jgi:L-asparaginase/Glu-tRNA(Gln) amidotransferase subunit D
MGGEISHDQVTRMLSSSKMTSKAWWKLVKPHVRKIEQEDGVMIIEIPL